MAQVGQLTVEIGVYGEPLTGLRIGDLGLKEPRISFLSPGRTLLSGGLCECAIALWKGWWGKKRSRTWEIVASFSLQE
ncbi:MAG TPA: hypothetical protein DCE56_19705 [Cyanobacteria bacterium UBA8553]|nr:hypothetical protein [Cyanobacteria bacterium UBA8553]HAJ60072.1 hypothetical protein [Cyanobacteria bacterium UBA8543]